MKERTAITCHIIRKDGREFGHAQVLEGQEYVVVRGNFPSVYRRSSKDKTRYLEVDTQFVQLVITGEHAKAWHA
tara:strand:+ start:3683 stop:3904 length:222 start_codon:yes stop_codon:yes gene_type:complete